MITDAADRGSAQAERIAMWLHSEEAYFREQRETLRAEWVSYYHERLAANHRSLAADHARAARELNDET